MYACIYIYIQKHIYIYIYIHELSENNFAICFLLEIPPRRFPSQIKFYDQCSITRHSTNFIVQRISFEKGIPWGGCQAGHISQTSCPKIASFTSQDFDTVSSASIEGNYIYIYIYIYTYTYVCLCICVCIYIFHIYIYIYMYTYMFLHGFRGMGSARPPDPGVSSSTWRTYIYIYIDRYVLYVCTNI